MAVDRLVASWSAFGKHTDEIRKEAPLILGVGSKYGLGSDRVWGPGLAPIHLAALHGRIDCLRLLVEKHKIDVNLPSLNGWRPIHLAISNSTGDRSLQTLKYLLEKGADPSITNEDGVTPVHQAASEGHIQCLKLLIAVGAVIDRQDKRGHAPIDLAKLWGHRKCARILALEQWHKEKDDIASEMKQLRKSAVRRALKDIETEDKKGEGEHFYGDKAYKHWLNKQGLQQVPSGDKNSSNKKPTSPSKEFRAAASETKEKPVPKLFVNDTPISPVKQSQNVYQPNSVARQQEEPQKQPEVLQKKPERPFTVKIPEVEKEVDNKKIQLATKDHVNRIGSASTVNYEAGLYDDDVGVSREELSPRLASAPEKSMTPWNFSPKIKSPEYVPNLPDAYPRDIYTMIPLVEATPKNLNVRAQTPKIFITDVRQRVKRVDDNINRKVSMASRQDSAVANINDRPQTADRDVVFRCKNVLDIERRRKPRPGIVPKSEAAIHLSDDLQSKLVRLSLCSKNGFRSRQASFSPNSRPKTVSFASEIPSH